MRIERVVARAFGPFHGEVLDLAPGLNVIAGPNEAGKSTWHAAIRLALTGVRRGKGPGTAAERQLAERHRPWGQDDQWLVEARITLDDGRRIDIAQDLAGKVACRATDVGLGRDVSNEILDGTPDASRWLGLDREAFASTVCVSQAQILSVADAAEQLQEHMQRAAATRGTDATAAEAIARLEQFRRDAVGADTVAAKGPLRTARNRLAAAEAALADARARHEAYLEQAAGLEQAERRAEEARRALDEAEAALARRDSLRIAEKLALVEQLSARHPRPPQPIAELDDGARQVARALQAWDDRPQLPSLAGASAEALEAELASLPPAPEGDTRPHASVLDAARGLDLADEALRQHGAPPESGAPLDDSWTPQQLRELARRLRAPQLPDAARLEAQLASARAESGAVPSRWQLPALAAVVLLGLGGALGILVDPVIGVGIAVAGAAAAAVAWFLGGSRRRARARVAALETALAPYRQAAAAAERDRHAAIATARDAGLPIEPEAVDTLADRAASAAHDHQLAAAWDARHASLEARQATARAALLGALQERGAEVSGLEPREALARYVAASEERSIQAERAARAEGLGRQLEARRVAEAALGAATRARQAADVRIREAALIARLDADAEPTGLVAALRAWQEHRSAQIERQAGEVAEWERLQALLAGTSLAALRSEAAERARRAEELDGALVSPAARALVDAPGLEGRIARLREELATEQGAADRLGGSLRQLAAGLPSVAEAEESAAAAAAEMERVESAAQVIDEALGLLRAAEEQVHRSLAPVLNDAVARWLPDVCDGAYDEVSVDPATLGVSVKERESGQWRQVRLLSEGTREQIYLLLRVAMAQHLVTTGETAPLLLDEVTAQSDGTRKRRLLEVLHGLSTERQIVLFTHDDEVARWADASLDPGRDRLVRLASPWSSDAGLLPAPMQTVG